ncbi:hypothetical protein F4680DRAFT_466730 [Xylaria scruposa]|nr:hypothetical protein F4680DRAFT_466730 [Xylaria scruposa]
MPSPISISDVLDHDHYEAFTTAIIDGLPLSWVAQDRYGERLDRHHPINLHTKLCTRAFEHAQLARELMCMDSFSFETKLLQPFQSSAPRSRRFQLRLIELVAVALHRVAIYLFQEGARLHDRYCSPIQYSEGSSDVDVVTSWEPPPDEWPDEAPWPTLFVHPAFTAHEQYPDGVADLVGYWAEDRILGGVALFDRSHTWGDGDLEPNVYFQSSRPKRTYQIYQLTDRQQQGLLRFLYPQVDHSHDTQKGDSQDNLCPLPTLFYRNENHDIVDPEFAVVNSQIYRDPWERPPPRCYLKFI